MTKRKGILHELSSNIPVPVEVFEYHDGYMASVRVTEDIRTSDGYTWKAGDTTVRPIGMIELLKEPENA